MIENVENDKIKTRANFTSIKIETDPAYLPTLEVDCIGLWSIIFTVQCTVCVHQLHSASLENLTDSGPFVVFVKYHRHLDPCRNVYIPYGFISHIAG